MNTLDSQGKCILILSDRARKKQEIAFVLQLLLKQTLCVFTPLKGQEGELSQKAVDLVLCDFNKLDCKFWEDYESHVGEYKYLGILNTPSDECAYELLRHGAHGVFYPDDSVEVITKGVRCILNSELWYKRSILSRMVSMQLASQVSSQRHNIYDLNNQFSKREIEVLKYIAKGCKNRDIAKMLYISEHTIKSHVKHIFRKLDMQSRIDVIDWARDYFPKEVLMVH